MPKKQIVKDIQDLEILKPEATEVKTKPKRQIIIEVSDDEEDEPIEASKIELEPKVKKERSIKQKEAFEKATIKRQENEKMRREHKQMTEEKERVKTDEKIVSKAISIKKKQIKRNAILDEVSDDDTPIEVIKKVINRKQPVQQIQPQPQQQRYYFV